LPCSTLDGQRSLSHTAVLRLTGPYDPSELRGIPSKHIAFVQQLRLYYETGTHIFVHASFDPDFPLDKQDRCVLLWRGLDHVPVPHRSSKIAVVGHTPQPNHRILDLGHLKCLDTGCGEGGLLTALDVGSGQVWLVDERGQIHG
jgi:serine/threonine protein phosphatase 1